MPWLFDLHKAVFKEYVEQIWGWDEDWQKDYFFKMSNLGDSQLIKVNDEVIGGLTIENKSNHIFLAYIALLPELQNKGIGSTVVGSVMSEANGKPIPLMVLNPNPVKLLCERLGFVITERDDIRTKMTYG